MSGETKRDVSQRGGALAAAAAVDVVPAARWRVWTGDIEGDVSRRGGVLAAAATAAAATAAAATAAATWRVLSGDVSAASFVRNELSLPCVLT